jgi:FtsP/CotA-like multicopper oxidase with cupredoxin domain
MSSLLSRRSFLASGSACVGAALITRYANVLFTPPNAVPANPTILTATLRTMEINGKSATLMGLDSPGSRTGLSFAVDQPFNIQLDNHLPVPTAIHWHGLHPPNSQDGVPGLTQPMILANAIANYNFPVIPSGTHWMHSHQGLQEAFLLAAPLIVHDPADEPKDEQQIIIFLGDFSFTPPREIYANLRKPKPMAMSTQKAGEKTSGNKMQMPPDANDVNYDAYLANDRTLADPDVVRVDKNSRLRLRIINGSSGTNYFVDLGDLEGELIATDGMNVAPVKAAQFPLAIAQRIDVRVQLPADGAFPILGLRELATEQTGIILATPGAAIKKLPLNAPARAGLLNLDLESRLVAAQPLAARPIDRSFDLRLGGDMSKYSWTINNIIFDTEHPSTQAAQVHVKQGQRIAIKFTNETAMPHPMHLHGHSFQVVEINGKPLKGALRDTILIPARSTVTVAFDANNPGIWYLHCHILWHLAAGMATLVQYES